MMVYPFLALLVCRLFDDSGSTQIIDGLLGLFFLFWGVGHCSNQLKAIN